MARLTLSDILAKLPDQQRDAVGRALREEARVLLDGLAGPKPRGKKAITAAAAASLIHAENFFTEDVNAFLNDERPFGPETILTHRHRVAVAWAVAQLIN